MILVTHALVGAVIGKNINNPLIIIPLSLVTHYALDSQRHGEYLDKTSKFGNTWWKIALDISAGFLFILSFITIKDFDLLRIRNILIGSFSSLFPDFLTLLFWIYPAGFLKKLHSFHEWVHRYFFSEELKWSLKNALNDILVSLLAIIFLFL
ncbi:MAG: hypothetical protein CO141_02165 [Candidatus Moranbacteria bacterium CG_4_9_14_3_um_filter_42_9]|nr:MAG: hypothetical protein CO141_02165 [Candidatus Moranbacteria bacterium CG_4_9_14_3_um_filter_42_9]